MSRSMVIAGALVVGTAGAVTWQGLASAAGEELNACVDNKSGVVRLVDAGAACRSGERSVTWSITGPQGIQGEQGVQGEQGLQGEKGDKGDPGAAPVAARAGTLTIPDETGTPLAPIEIESFSLGATATLGTGGTSMGRTQYSDVAVTKPLDDTSVRLLRYISQGRRLGEVRLTLCDPTACAATTTGSYTLTDVLVTSLSQTGDGESLTLLYRSMTFTHGTDSVTVSTSTTT